MINTVEKIGELVKNTPSDEVPIISYYEWLTCFNDFMCRIKNDNTDDPEFFYNGGLLRLVSPNEENMSENELREYKECFELIGKFNRAYKHAPNFYNHYQANAKEVLMQVLNGTADYGPEDPYRALR